MKDTNNNTPITFTPLQFTSNAESHLKSSAKWGLFLSIIGFLIILLLVIFSITMFVLSGVKSEFADFQNMPVPFMLEFLGVLYLIFAIIYFFPTYNLLKFSTKISSAFENNDQVALEDALKNLKRMFAFIGILTIMMFLFSAFSMAFAFLSQI